MLSVCGLRAKLGDFTLGPIDLQAPAGAYVALVGPSGHGKTSLLWALTGATPSEGEVCWRDISWSNDPPERRRIAIVPQGGQLFPHLSVAENIGYAGTAHVRELADAWGATTLLERRVDKLSGGERMRVSIARALGREPELLLLDEPLSAIDEASRASLREKLRALRGSRTVIHVTHDLDEAAALATHLGVMREGKLVAFGPAEDVLLRPPSHEVAQFLGVENVLAGTFEPHGEDASLFHTGALTLHVLARASGAGYVTIPERAVMLSLQAPHEVSARNAIEGNVAAIQVDREGARVELAGAVRIVARLERESVAALGLEPGKRVVAVVKAAQIRAVGSS